MDYAIFKTGGKQYRVSPGDVIDIDITHAEPGSIIELDNVLAMSRGGELTLGQPTVPGAKVIAELEAQTRDKKIIVFKFKRKVRYRRKQGHRQGYSRIAIRELLLAGEEASPSDTSSVVTAVAPAPEPEEEDEAGVTNLVADDEPTAEAQLTDADSEVVSTTIESEPEAEGGDERSDDDTDEGER